MHVRNDGSISIQVVRLALVLARQQLLPVVILNVLASHLAPEHWIHTSLALNLSMDLSVLYLTVKTLFDVT